MSPWKSNFKLTPSGEPLSLFEGLREEYQHFHPEDRRRENHIGMQTFGTMEKLASGSFTPTATAISNVTALIVGGCRYARIGDVVVISGVIQCQPTVISTQTDFRFTLPIPSNFTSTQDCTGVTSTAQYYQPGALFGDTVNDEAQIRYISATIDSRSIYFSGMYTIK